MDRRRFLKYAGATAAVIGASSLGYGYLKPQPTHSNQATTSSVVSVTRIAALTYEPSKIANDKMYDVRVNVKISNPAQRLSYVQVELQPVVYEQLPSEGFATEEAEITTIQPTGLETEILSTSFRNLKGGREYDVKASAYAPNGIIDTGTLRTEYVREFENIAPLDDLVVIATYCPRYNLDDPWFELWKNRDVWLSLGYKARPLLGGYSSRDPTVIAKHIDWATGHRVDAFAVSWGFGDENGGWGDITFKDFILAHPLSSQIRWCVLYEDINARLPTEEDENGVKIVNFDNPDVRRDLLRDFDYLAGTYFKHPCYLRIEDRLVVYFDGSRFWRGSSGSVSSAIDELRQAMKAKGFELYLISSQLGDWIPYTSRKAFDGQIQREVITSLDAVSTDSIWILNSWNSDARRDFISYVDALYNQWYGQMNDMKRDMIPNMTPGWEAYPWKGTYSDVTKDMFLSRDPKRFQQLIQVCKRYSLQRTYLVGSFNNVWFESTQVEPDTQDGFAYLDVLKNGLI